MPEPVHHSVHHSLVALKKTPHNRLKINLVYHDLRLLQYRIRIDGLHRRNLRIQDESVYMILDHIVPQALFHHLFRDFLRKRHLENHFYPGLMARLNHILQFTHRILGTRVRSLRREPVCRSVPPVIPIPAALLKIIHRHTLNLVDP